MALKTLEEAKAYFSTTGMSVLEWAKEKRLPYGAVLAVLAGQRKGKRGIGHDVAVELGLKAGTRLKPNGYPNKLEQKASKK